MSKKHESLALLMMFAAATGQASTVMLQWDPVNHPALLGYKVYYVAGELVLPLKGTGAQEGASPLTLTNLTTATISGLDPGSAWHFAVTAMYNTIGESGYSNIVSVMELLPPVVEVTSPPAGSLVSAKVPIQVSADDNVGVTRVEYYVNGILLCTDTEKPFVCTWDTSALLPGNYAITSKAFDAAGNAAQSRTSLVTVVRDSTPPAVALASPANGSIVSGSVAVTATASDLVGVTRVDFYVDGNPVFTTNVAPFSFTWNTAAVAEGSHTLQVRASDNSGNTGSASSTVTVTKSAAPTQCILGDLNGNGVLGIEDATLAMQISVGKVNVSSDQLRCGDIAPVINGKSAPNGKIDTGDAIVILSRIVGKIGPLTIQATSPATACLACAGP